MISASATHAFRDYAVILFLLFQLKHFVFDWLYQPPYQYLNKGKFGHWGGIVHSLQHAMPTLLILHYFCGIPFGFAAALSGVEFVIHYMMDFMKVNTNKLMGWGPTTSEWWFRFLGFDQMIHQLTYLWLIFVALS